VIVRVAFCPDVLINTGFIHVYRYDWGMINVEQYLDNLQARGRICFSRDEALCALETSEKRWQEAATRLIKKQHLVSPRRGFYVILRPEDRISGTPDPSRWIASLMKYIGVDYRISLLRAAAFHGSSHQAAMVFQVIAPKQLSDVTLGRHQIQFVYQQPKTFSAMNRPEWLGQLKSDTGYAQVAGIELTLLDCMRYFHKAAGISGVAQMVKDIGNKVRPALLAKAASHYEHSTVRRLGYLLDLAGFVRQSNALLPIASKARSLKLLDPSTQSLSDIFSEDHDVNQKWMLTINETVEFDF
jgi:predicted transcriptional regulator of viral defense system